MAVEGFIAREVNTEIPEQYRDEEYKRYRQSWFGSIPKSNTLQATRSIFNGLAGAMTVGVGTAIVVGLIHLSVFAVSMLAVGIVATTAIAAYANYLDEKMSKSVGVAYNEAKQVVDSRVQGVEMAHALQETLGQELKEARAENRQTQEALIKMQDRMQNWQEREAVREPGSQVLH